MLAHNMDINSFEQTVDSDLFTLMHTYKTELFFLEVKNFSEEVWSSKIKKNSYENYDFDSDKEWSLGKMLTNGTFDFGYTLLYKNSELISCGGLRKLDSTSTISMARFISRNTVIPYGSAFILPLHLKISKEQNYESTIITFNDYNEHATRYFQNILPNSKNAISKIAQETMKHFNYEGKTLINHTTQDVFRCHL